MTKNQAVSKRVQAYWRKRRSVPGAFWDIDFLIFDRILQMQDAQCIRGDLLEIGALFGKSAIVLGQHAKPQEKVIVCDIFEDAEGDAENVEENIQSYTGLNRAKFEENYSKWVDQLPVVIADLSTNIVNKVESQSLRFAHIDGSHLFEVVRMDIANTRTLLNENGIVVMDDFRALHTPGVAAAVWDAVSNQGLTPICITEQKFYGSWNPRIALDIQDNLTRWIASQQDALNYGIQDIAGMSTLIIQNPAPWGGKLQIVVRIPNPWRPIQVVIEVPAPWRKHIAASRMRDVVNYSWGRPYLGKRSGPTEV